MPHSAATDPSQMQGGNVSPLTCLSTPGSINCVFGFTCNRKDGCPDLQGYFSGTDDLDTIQALSTMAIKCFGPHDPQLTHYWAPQPGGHPTAGVNGHPEAMATFLKDSAEVLDENQQVQTSLLMPDDVSRLQSGLRSMKLGLTPSSFTELPLWSMQTFREGSQPHATFEVQVDDNRTRTIAVQKIHFPGDMHAQEPGSDLYSASPHVVDPETGPHATLYPSDSVAWLPAEGIAYDHPLMGTWNNVASMSGASASDIQQYSPVESVRSTNTSVACQALEWLSNRMMPYINVVFTVKEMDSESPVVDCYVSGTDDVEVVKCILKSIHKPIYRAHHQNTVQSEAGGDETDLNTIIARSMEKLRDDLRQKLPWHGQSIHGVHRADFETLECQLNEIDSAFPQDPFGDMPVWRAISPPNARLQKWARSSFGNH